MSKFVDKLQHLSRSSAPSIGFHPSARESKGAAMLLIAGLRGVNAKEAGALVNNGADAGLILNQGFNTRIVKQMVKAAGEVPLGVFVKDVSQDKVSELVSSGCDFVVFDTKVPGAVLQQEGIGKFLMIAPSLEQGLVRAINNLDVDGVFINKGEEPFITVEHLLIYQRFSELLNKPLIVTLPSLVTSAELSNLRQIGIHGVVIPSTESKEALAELRRMLDNLPKEARGRRGRLGVILPRYGGGVDIGEEEEEEEEES